MILPKNKHEDCCIATGVLVVGVLIADPSNMEAPAVESEKEGKNRSRSSSRNGGARPPGKSFCCIVAPWPKFCVMVKMFHVGAKKMSHPPTN